MNWEHPEIGDAIRRAIEEDIGPGDVTSEACIPADAVSNGKFLAGEGMVVAGLELLPQIYQDAQVELIHSSGDLVEENAELARVEGNTRRLLALERTALNFVQRLSGIATLARNFVDAVEGTGCTILDTRKTTPGLRRLEKLAVAAGGATNHRMGLYDAILIKNNHIEAAGGVRQAFERAQSKGLPIEIEVRSFEEIDEALAAGATHMLLDNFSPADIREAVKRIGGRAKTEVSGSVKLETVRAYAECGVDYCSAGALTHSARAMDVKFRIA